IETGLLGFLQAFPELLQLIKILLYEIRHSFTTLQQYLSFVAHIQIICPQDPATPISNGHYSFQKGLCQFYICILMISLYASSSLFLICSVNCSATLAFSAASIT